EDLLAQALVIDVLGGGQALVGVGEAHLVHAVLALDHVGGGAGGGQGEDAVGHGQLGGADAGLGGDGAQRDLHAPVLQGVVGVDRGLGDVHVVLVVQLELDGAALGVDLVHGDLGAALCSQAVDGGVAGQGAGAADLEGRAGGGAGVLGSGGLR